MFSHPVRISAATWAVFILTAVLVGAKVAAVGSLPSYSWYTVSTAPLAAYFGIRMAAAIFSDLVSTFLAVLSSIYQHRAVKQTHKMLLAGVMDPKANVKTLYSALQFKDPMLLRSVACHPNVTVPMLKELAKSQDETVLAAVLSNPKTPEEVAEPFVSHKSAMVRLALASRDSILHRTRTTLIQDSHAEVAAYAVLRASSDSHLWLAIDSDQKLQHHAAAANPNLNQAQMLALVRQEDPETLRHLAQNPSCTEQVLRNLREDLRDDLEGLTLLVQHPNLPQDLRDDLTGSQGLG